eukprot:4986879-Lingulodinium_polyedra.AAC.1
MPRQQCGQRPCSVESYAEHHACIGFESGIDSLRSSHVAPLANFDTSLAPGTLSGCHGLTTH